VGFRTLEGLKQGCVLSPTLFKIDLESVLYDWNQRCKSMVRPVGNETIHHLRFTDDQAIIAQDEVYAEYMTKKLIEEYLRWGLHVNIHKIEYVNIGSDIQNIKLEHDIEIKGSRSFMYLGSIFMNPGKCNEEVLNTNEQARNATEALNSLLWSKYISVNKKK